MSHTPGKIYPTVKDAHDALCLDVGFDPFLHGGAVGLLGHIWRKPTRIALHELGYRVATKRAAIQAAKGAHHG